MVGFKANAGRPGFWSAVALLLLLTGCASQHYRAIQDHPGDLSSQARIEDVPFYPQEKFYCGPAALAMMLNWAEFTTTQEKVAEQVYTPGRKGTLPTDLLSGARRHGALAVEVASLRDMLGEIAAGNPVLVFQNLGLPLWPQWHFAVAFEYDLSNNTIVLHSGTEERHEININAFEKTWARADYWAITVTPPDQLPVHASVSATLDAASGLERAGQLTAAYEGYQAIGQRWPDNITAHIGLGNTLYSQGNYSGAADSYKAALQIDPEYAPAWNNLAYSLLEAGEYDVAIAAARQAIQHAGENSKNYQQTLGEIEKAAAVRQ